LNRKHYFELYAILYILKQLKYIIKFSKVTLGTDNWEYDQSLFGRKIAFIVRSILVHYPIKRIFFPVIIFLLLTSLKNFFS